MIASLRSSGRYVAGLVRKTSILGLALAVLVASASLVSATEITYTLPTTGFQPANVTALGVAAIGGWSGYLAVVLPIALFVGLTLAAIGWFMGLFHAKKAAR